VDLYNPVETSYSNPRSEYSVIHLYHMKKNGLPDLRKPVTGTGPGTYVGGGKGYVSFLDDGKHNGYDGKHKAFLAMYTDVNGEQKAAVESMDYGSYSDYGGQPPPTTLNSKGVYTGGPVLNTSGKPAPGNFLGKCAMDCVKDENGHETCNLRQDEKGGAWSTCHGTGIMLSPGTATAVRMPSSLKIGDVSASCWVASYVPTKMPSSGVVPNMFIPTNSKKEFERFATAMLAGKVSPEDPTSVTMRPCLAEYALNSDPTIPSLRPTAAKGTKTWTGMISCDDLTARPSCNETRVISAQRYCRLENGSFDACGSCDHAEDPDKALNFDMKSVNGDVLVNPKLAQTKCFFSAACYANSSEECPASGSSGGHVFCLSSDTKIKMADGTEKEIIKIKPGERVMAFNAKHTRNGALSTAIVKATAVTKKQKIVKINDLRITPLHKIVLSTGRAVMAKEIRVGDKILKADGSVEEVTKIDTRQAPITVYNLVLENGNDGYIANGVRVLSYPILKGMSNEEAERGAILNQRMPQRSVSSKQAE
jgi:hypothetical protein